MRRSSLGVSNSLWVKKKWSALVLDTRKHLRGVVLCGTCVEYGVVGLCDRHDGVLRVGTLSSALVFELRNHLGRRSGKAIKIFRKSGK